MEALTGVSGLLEAIVEGAGGCEWVRVGVSG